jgi:hypothetical protein
MEKEASDTRQRSDGQQKVVKKILCRRTKKKRLLGEKMGIYAD